MLSLLLSVSNFVVGPVVSNHNDSSSVVKPVNVLLVPRLHLDLVIEVVVALCRHVLVLDREGEPVGSQN